MRTSIIIMLALGILCFMVLVANCFGETAYIDTPNLTIVNAIYIAEGGANTKYPYGIVSIDTKGDEVYARKICFNTVRNNKVRFMKQEEYKCYIEFLGSRYAPIGAKNDPKGLNKNWVKNVKYYIDK